MPRSQQSREGAIVAYFTSADLAIAQVIYKLAGDALKARLSKSEKQGEAQRKVQAEAASKAVAEATPKPVVKLAPPAKKRKRVRPSRVKARPLVTEEELNEAVDTE